MPLTRGDVEHARRQAAMEAAGDQRQRDIADVCGYCGAGELPRRHDGKWFHGRLGELFPGLHCRAEAIHERHWRQQGREGSLE